MKSAWSGTITPSKAGWGFTPTSRSYTTVTADQAAIVIWNGYAYHIGPNTPLEIQLDASAQATVLYEAVDLKPPAITFTAYDTDNNINTVIGYFL